MFSETHHQRPGSCREGGVVHMMAASGVRVPVRLSITTKDDTSGERQAHRHIVKVT